MTRTMPTSPGRPRCTTRIPCPGLRHALERLGLSTTAAAKLAGWERTRVAMWASQSHAPTIALRVLCRVLSQYAEKRGLEPVTLESLAAPPTDLAAAEERLRVALRRAAAAEAELAAALVDVDASRAAFAEVETAP